MNRKMNNGTSYLSLKTMVVMSLIISVFFHLFFMLSFHYSEALLMNSDIIESRKPISYSRIAVHFLLNFLLLMLLFLYNRKIMRIGFKKKAGELAVLVFGSLLITVALSVLFTTLPLAIHKGLVKLDFMFFMVRGGLMRDFSFMCIVILTSQLLRSVYFQHVVAVENEALRTENMRTRYKALKNQMDPHFLFNSLNTLQSLLGANAEKAQDYLQQLSVVLRSSLHNKEVVTLEEEIKSVLSYCNLMQIRYGENLTFVFNIDTSYYDRFVLPLSLQGLVENAIKHNVISAKQPLCVTISTAPGATISVENAIQQKLTSEPSNGIGLASLAERYRLKWGEEVAISSEGERFKVTLPLMEKN